MEHARKVLDRLERIDAMQRAEATPAELLDELRALLMEAEAWARSEGGEAGEAAAARLRSSLSRDIIVA